MLLQVTILLLPGFRRDCALVDRNVFLDDVAIPSALSALRWEVQNLELARLLLLSKAFRFLPASRIV